MKNIGKDILQKKLYGIELKEIHYYHKTILCGVLVLELWCFLQMRFGILSFYPACLTQLGWCCNRSMASYNGAEPNRAQGADRRGGVRDEGYGGIWSLLLGERQSITSIRMCCQRLKGYLPGGDYMQRTVLWINDGLLSWNPPSLYTAI